jgi:hypothetical protein
MAHEITHVVARSDFHATEGVMKAHWNLRDVQQMVPGLPLPFDQVSEQLIHGALERQAEQVPGNCGLALKQPLP